MCWLTAELGLHVLTLDLQGCSTSGCPGKEEGRKERAQKKLEDWHQFSLASAEKADWWQENLSLQEINFLLHQSRHGQHGEEEQNSSVSWPGGRHKPSLGWTLHNTLSASAAGPAFLFLEFPCAEQWDFLPLPLGNLPDKQSLCLQLNSYLFPCHLLENTIFFLLTKTRKEPLFVPRSGCAVQGQLLWHLQVDLARCARPLFLEAQGAQV